MVGRRGDKAAQGPSSPLGILTQALGLHREKKLGKEQNVCITQQFWSRGGPSTTGSSLVLQRGSNKSVHEGQSCSQECSLLLLEQPGPPGAGVSIL